MIKLPLNSEWTQLNKSDKFGSLAYTKNINLDEAGYLKLSPRTVNIFDDDESLANNSDTNFDFPVAFGRTGGGSFYIGTTDEPFNLSLSNITKSIAEDTSASNPNMSFDSHGCWYLGRWHASTSTAVNYITYSTGNWTANAITGLTSGVRHYMTVHKTRGQLCVSNGNVVKQYDSSYANTQDLTISTDYEVIGMDFNNEKIGIITRLGDNADSQNAEAVFITWDGATGNPNTMVSVGAYACIAVKAYKSSFVILTNQGQLLYWNGGGFDELANFPFYNTESRLDDLLNFASYGDIMTVDGGVIYINLGFAFSSVGKKGQEYLQNCPCGVWCYDPEIGLYHRYSASLSRMFRHQVLSANVNITTDVFTTSITIPATGNPMIMTQGGSDLSVGTVYYVIKLTDTTFQIAETKEKALAGVYIDITEATDWYFFMTELRDYGIGHFEASGAIATWGNSRYTYRDVLFGGRLTDESQLSVLTLNTAVPFLENRGYFVTPKLFLDNTTENIPRLVIKHKALDTNDAIIVKVKTTDYVGLPVSSPNTYAGSDQVIWTSDNECYTESDLSEAKTVFDNRADNKQELELELLSGSGAGQMVKITDITYEAGVYSLVVEEPVIGASSGLKSDFIIDTWKVCASVDVNTQKEGIFEVPIARDSRAPQFKIELRGYETTIEDILINNVKHKE